MQLCKYCNTIKHGEFETLKDKSYMFFYTCPKCKSIYEGKAKTIKKETKVIKSRWYNSKEQRCEDINNY